MAMVRLPRLIAAFCGRIESLVACKVNADLLSPLMGERPGVGVTVQLRCGRQATPIPYPSPIEGEGARLGDSQVLAVQRALDQPHGLAHAVDRHEGAEAGPLALAKEHLI